MEHELFEFSWKLLRDLEQRLRWSDLENGHYEFIVKRIEPINGERIGRYEVFKLKVLSLIELGRISKQSSLTISFPLKSFKTAFYTIPEKERLAFDRDYFYINFEKINRKNIKIKEIRKLSLEELTIAQQNFKV